MALELKRYQSEGLEALARFFDLARGAADQAGLDAAYRQTLGEWDIPASEIPPYLAQGFGATPYVCIRIPTGGGKTLLGAHAIATASRHFTGAEHPLTLWLCPSNIIRQQTLNALRQPGHPYREALEAHFGVDGLRVLDIAECEQLRAQDFHQKAIVVVGTMQTLRVDDTSGRDVYAYKEAFEPHFEGAPDLAGFERVKERDLEVQPYLSRVDLGKVKRSFANLLYWHRPIVIIDEAHNARTPLSYDTFARLNPAVLIEMTATPIRKGSHRSNVLYHVSAEELKTEQMIKLPIVLHTHPNWQEAVRDALLTRHKLAEEARGEADYIRPILLFQAEDKSGEVTVERLKEYLVEQEHISANRIAIATGKQRELDGLDLFDAKCPIEIVITVEALKEGWDCSFAYVFCTLQKIGSSKDMEQLLGRVLRMPYARSRKSPLLNRAYAHVASPRTLEVANDLADRLVAMGFEEMEAAQAVFPTTAPLFESGGEGIDLVPPVLELNLPAAPDLGLLPRESISQVVITSRPEGGVTVTLREAPAPDLRDALLSVVPKKDREKVERLIGRFELRNEALLSPSARGIPFKPLPMLCVRYDQDELELADRVTLVDLGGFSLRDAPADLEGFDPEDSRKPYLVDIEQGHIRVEQEAAAYSVNLDLVRTEVSQTDLVKWLDGRLRQADLSQTEMLAWLNRVVTGLLREKGFTLTALVRHRNRLADAVAERLKSLRVSAQAKGLQLTLLGPDPRGCVSPDFNFRFGAGMYPARPPYYEGRYRFKKHYYGVIGDLLEAPRARTDHEYHCAVAMDELPQVKHWVRNLPRHPEFSFWLPTSSDNFYPDFVAELMDGRLLVVEYKGEGYKSNDDSSEKRMIGEYWARASGNLFLMAVDKDTAGRGVKAQLKALLGDAPTEPAAKPFSEHETVRLITDFSVDGVSLKRNTVGTVVSVYGGGEAYAVEFVDENDKAMVVVLKRPQLEKATLQ
ncbi:MAG: DEAD/DEAH box helicase family protein [Thiobacillus sp.]|nr:DEAD/DEAH box helicase family protein [Thiobacillus sp.]